MHWSFIYCCSPENPVADDGTWQSRTWECVVLYLLHEGKRRVTVELEPCWGITSDISALSLTFEARCIHFALWFKKLLVTKVFLQQPRRGDWSGWFNRIVVQVTNFIAKVKVGNFILLSVLIESVNAYSGVGALFGWGKMEDVDWYWPFLDSQGWEPWWCDKTRANRRKRWDL